MPQREKLLERLSHYRQLAEEAQTTAQHMPLSEYRDTYLRIARDWTDLAQEIERSGLPPTAAY